MPIYLDTDAITHLLPHDNRTFEAQAERVQERVNYAIFWDVREGESILEIGCGQGECTAVLATAVGEHGKVTALDPAPPDYGGPPSIGQSQSHLLASDIKDRIKFVRSDPVTFLLSASIVYDATVLCHCIWYFASPTVLLEILHLLSTRSKRVCLAEWSLSTSRPSSVPHVLAALTSATLYCHQPDSRRNIRTILSPQRIIKKAVEAGFALKVQVLRSVSENVADGIWEVRAVTHNSFAQQVEDSVDDAGERAVLHALQDATRASWVALGDAVSISSMDVWCAVLQAAVI